MYFIAVYLTALPIAQTAWHPDPEGYQLILQKNLHEGVNWTNLAQADSCEQSTQPP